MIPYQPIYIKGDTMYSKSYGVGNSIYYCDCILKFKRYCISSLEKGRNMSCTVSESLTQFHMHDYTQKEEDKPKNYWNSWTATFKWQSFPSPFPDCRWNTSCCKLPRTVLFGWGNMVWLGIQWKALAISEFFLKAHIFRTEVFFLTIIPHQDFTSGFGKLPVKAQKMSGLACHRVYPNYWILCHYRAKAVTYDDTRKSTAVFQWNWTYGHWNMNFM